MAKTINNWCLQGIIHSVQMDCSFRRNDGKNDNRSNRNGTTLLALDCHRDQLCFLGHITFFNMRPKLFDETTESTETKIVR